MHAPLNASNVAASEDDKSQELVIVLMGPTGSGVQEAEKRIAALLQSEYDYKIGPRIHLDMEIVKNARHVDDLFFEQSPIPERIKKMHKTGQKIRDKFGQNYLISQVVRMIAESRAAGDHAERRACFITGIQTTHELEALKTIYGDAMISIGVGATDKIRTVNLKKYGFSDDDIDKLIEKSAPDLQRTDENVLKCFNKSDLFLYNTDQGIEFDAQIQRYFSLVFDEQIHNPTPDEIGIAEAYAASFYSPCSARQVGAVVKAGDETLSVGWNHATEPGEIYAPENPEILAKIKAGCCDGTPQGRCCDRPGGGCHQDPMRELTVDEQIMVIEESGLIKEGIDKTALRQALFKPLLRLMKPNISFTSGSHAEEVNCYKIAAQHPTRVSEAKMYSTNECCQGCTVQVKTVGFHCVIYLWRFVKSYAKALHPREMTDDPGDVMGPDGRPKILIRQFSGIAPWHLKRAYGKAEPQPRQQPFHAKTAMALRFCIASKVRNQREGNFLQENRPAADAGCRKNPSDSDDPVPAARRKTFAALRN